MQIKRRRPRYWYLVIAVVVAVPLALHFRKGSGDEPVIKTAVVKRGTVTATVSANGILQPLTTVQVKSNVGGQVVELAVDEGDLVRPGQLIAKIDPTDSITALQQSQADLAAATSRVRQAREQLTMQRQQTDAQIESAREALEAARARLEQAREQASIQPELTAASIKQARSNLDAAESALSQMRTATVPQKTAAAQAAYDQARATYDTASKDLARQKELLAKGFVSKGQVEASEERYNVAKAQVDSARRKFETMKDETDQDLRSAEAKVGQARAQLENALAGRTQDRVKRQELVAAQAAVKQAEAALQVALAARRENTIREGDIVQAGAQVQRAQASVKNARTQLGYTTIIAPRAGIVTKKYVEPGSIITAGRSSFSGSGSGVGIVDIADVTTMFALVSVDETDIGRVEVGQRVDVMVEAYPDVAFRGKVTKIAPQSVVEQNVTTIPVTVEIDTPDRRLKPGMNATCDFIIGRRENILVVPNEAIKESERGTMVNVLVDDKQVPRRVRTGLVGKETTEIVKGLKPGDKVVTAFIEPQPQSGGRGGMPGGPPRGMGGFGPGGRGGFRGR